MINFESAKIKSLVLHRVGNKALEEPLRLASEVLELDSTLLDLIKSWLLKPFSSEAFFNFHRETDLNLNEVYNYVSSLHDLPESILEQSINIGKHLYNQTSHPKIKSGDFFVVYFTDCVVDDEPCDAIGLFKSENKDTFLKIFPKNDNFSIEPHEGISLHKIDKGALIFLTEAELGYKISLADQVNKNLDTQYWRDNFLKVQQRNDNFYQTSSFLDLCKHFVSEVLTPDNQVERTQQIEVMNKSVNYFKGKDRFEQSEFENDVLGDPGAIEAFKQYKTQYQEAAESEIPESFEISPEAVKKAKSKFKNVLKLDKNFHIYVHGDRELIEKGFDSERNMNFYKVYFENED